MLQDAEFPLRKAVETQPISVKVFAVSNTQ